MSEAVEPEVKLDVAAAFDEAGVKSQADLKAMVAAIPRLGETIGQLRTSLESAQTEITALKKEKAEGTYPGDKARLQELESARGEFSTWLGDKITAMRAELENRGEIVRIPSIADAFAEWSGR